MIKATALFFAAILFFLSACTQNYGLLLTPHLENTRSENSASYYSTEKPELVFLYRFDERQVNYGRNLPVQFLKLFSNFIHDISFYPEIKLSSINSGYLSYSVITERSLTNSDIVFPFHYFW